MLDRPGAHCDDIARDEDPEDQLRTEWCEEVVVSMDHDGQNDIYGSSEENGCHDDEDVQYYTVSQVCRIRRLDLHT